MRVELGSVDITDTVAAKRLLAKAHELWDKYDRQAAETWRFESTKLLLIKQNLEIKLEQIRSTKKGKGRKP